MLKAGLFLGAVLVPVQLLFGHLNGDYVHDRQPAKFAAIEARWHDEQPAGEVLFAVPEAESERNLIEVKVPVLGSLIASMSSIRSMRRARSARSGMKSSAKRQSDTAAASDCRTSHETEESECD